VFDNVAIALEVLNLPTRLVRTRVGEALERVGLAGRGGDPARGALRRRAAARVRGPRDRGRAGLVLADEPTGNLDPQLAIDILGLFEDIHESGTTVLFATHDRTLLDVRPRRVVVLDDGRDDVPQGLAGTTKSWKTRRQRRAPSARERKGCDAGGESGGKRSSGRGARAERSPAPRAVGVLPAVAFVCLAASLLVVTNLAAVRDRWSRAGRATVYLRDTPPTPRRRTLLRALEAHAGREEGARS
jgi:energy-coupling factor transporter ATP-binding protein EcfA2